MDGRVVGVDATAEVGRRQRSSRVLGERGEGSGTALEAEDEGLVNSIGKEGRGVGVVVGVVCVGGGRAEALHRLGGVLAVRDEVVALGGAAELLNGEPEGVC